MAAGSPVLVYAGLADPIEEAQGLPLVPYALPTRVADATAVLDELGIDRAHVLGFSWGARLGFAIGEHAPARGGGSRPWPRARSRRTSVRGGCRA